MYESFYGWSLAKPRYEGYMYNRINAQGTTKKRKIPRNFLKKSGHQSNSDSAKDGATHHLDA